VKDYKFVISITWTLDLTFALTLRFSEEEEGLTSSKTVLVVRLLLDDVGEVELDVTVFGKFDFSSV